MELNLHGLDVREGEIILREGQAPAVYDPTNVSVAGIITSPGDWVAKRTGSKTEVDVSNAFVVANYTNRTITLRTDERSKFGDTIQGKLAIYPDLEKLKINANQTYNEKQLYDLIKFYGTYFSNKSQYTSLLDRLKRFEAKVEQEFQNSDDFKGALAQKKIRTITTEIDLNFQLEIPIFTGCDKLSFGVEINVGMENGTVIFWLESPQLHDLTVEQTEKIFEEQLDRLKDFAIIRQW